MLNSGLNKYIGFNEQTTEIAYCIFIKILCEIVIMAFESRCDLSSSYIMSGTISKILDLSLHATYTVLMRFVYTHKLLC